MIRGINSDRPVERCEDGIIPAIDILEERHPSVSRQPCRQVGDDYRDIGFEADALCFARINDALQRTAVVLGRVVQQQFSQSQRILDADTS